MPALLWVSLQPAVGWILWGLVVVLVAGLARRLARRPHARLAGACLGLAVLLAGWLIAEAAARLYDRLRYGVPLAAQTRGSFDRELGWVGKSQDAPSGAAEHWLVLGDSFTEAQGVAEADTYYRRLARALGWRVSVVAAGGWGTLQETLALERVLDRLRPQGVLLQVSSNDLINGEYGLESQSYFNRNLMVRPYLVEGRPRYRCPSRLGCAGLLLACHSRSAHYALGRLERVAARLARAGRVESVEARIARQGERLPEYARALSTADTVAARFGRRLQGTPWLAFPVDAAEPYVGDLGRILRRHGARWIEGAPAAVARSAAAGAVPVQADGAHWNALGHALAAEVLQAALRDGASPPP